MNLVNVYSYLSDRAYSPTAPSTLTGFSLSTVVTFLLLIDMALLTLLTPDWPTILHFTGQNLLCRKGTWLSYTTQQQFPLFFPFLIYPPPPLSRIIGKTLLSPLVAVFKGPSLSIFGPWIWHTTYTGMVCVERLSELLMRNPLLTCKSPN